MQKIIGISLDLFKLEEAFFGGHVMFFLAWQLLSVYYIELKFSFVKNVYISTYWLVILKITKYGKYSMH